MPGFCDRGLGVRGESLGLCPAAAPSTPAPVPRSRSLLGGDRTAGDCARPHLPACDTACTLGTDTAPAPPCSARGRASCDARSVGIWDFPYRLSKKNCVWG